jgi:EmrB/QacA subfamily drug resistance transporter
MTKQENLQAHTAHSGRKLQPPSIRWALASLSLSTLLSSLGTSIANVGLPTLELAFNASFQQVQWVVIAYLLAITALVVSIGRLADFLGRRRLLVGGIILFTGASVACGLAPELWMLIVARAAQGLGAAAMMSLALSFVGELMPKDQTGSAMGLLGTMSAIGTALGPSLGGVLIAGLGWRAIFLVNLPLGILAYWLAQRYLPADRQLRASPSMEFDTVGTVLLALALGAYALAMTVGRGSFGLLNLGLLGVAAVAAALFMRVEAKTAFPLVQFTLFSNRTLTASLVMSTLVTTVMMATLVVGPFYLARGLGLEPAVVGLTMSVGPLVSAFASIPVGRMTDRLGANRVTVLGLILMLVGTLLMSAAPATLGVPGYLAPIVITTMGYVLFQTANNTSVMTHLLPDQRGLIAGMLSLSRNLGLITGASVMGAVFVMASATTNIASANPDAIATGMRVTFAVAALLATIALTIAALSFKPRSR